MLKLKLLTGAGPESYSPSVQRQGGGGGGCLVAKNLVTGSL